MNTKSTLFVALVGLSAALVLGPTGCSTDTLLNVDNPDIVTPGNLTSPAALPTIRAGALGDFILAHSGSGADGSGGTEGQILASGLLSDELINSETFPTRIEVDRRGPILVDNGTAQNWFRTLSRARRAAEFAVAKYREFSDATKFTPAADTTKLSGLSEMLSVAGFTYVFFAENYCSGVPFSTANADGSLVYGSPLTSQQELDTAIARFDAAIAAANALTVPAPTFVNLASVGKARALLDEGQFAAAAAAVAAVPTSFAYTVTHSENTARENNGVFNATAIFKRYAVADQEGAYASQYAVSGTGPGLPYRSSADPRIPWRRSPATNTGFDRLTPQFDALRYPSRSAPVTLATGAEARLIEAEAHVAAADPTFYATLNALRSAPPAYLAPAGATIPAMGVLTTDSSTAAGGAVNLLFRERAYWLWLTGHRLSDMRRLVRQYNRPVNTVFPTGAYFKQSFQYGPDVNFPVPVDELNNPKFVSCIDRNP